MAPQMHLGPNGDALVPQMHLEPHEDALVLQRHGAVLLAEHSCQPFGMAQVALGTPFQPKVHSHFGQIGHHIP